ncbi:MAG: LAGLIDADG family homing endonuclease, partial [Actinomycetota bacterium]
MAKTDDDLVLTERAINMARFFTKPGIDPYSEIEWEQRDAVIGSAERIAFEQRNIEFPKTWSQNATNIVAQKYFRGPMDTPQRERSVKQMVSRVVDWYTDKGLVDGYFSGPEAVSSFSNELKYLLVRQNMAFNSPVWFNVGLVEPPRVSACQPYHALIDTPDGLIPIGEIVEGNRVGLKIFDAHGVTRVEAVKANGKKKVIGIKAGTKTIEVTEDHLVWRASAQGTGRFVPAGDLKVGDRVVWVRTESPGVGMSSFRDMAEAGLAGYLQTDGFVGKYSGTNKSYTIEFQTATEAEFEWIEALLDEVFPDVHRKVTSVELQDKSLVYRKTRLYGNVLKDFIERWGLMKRSVDAELPAQLLTAPLPVVSYYLRSVFQADGYVAQKKPQDGTLIGLATVSPKLMLGVQALLQRFGIYARLRLKHDKRPDRFDLFEVGIGTLSDQVRFADEIGFIDERKIKVLEASLDRKGLTDLIERRLVVQEIVELGEMDVYDIQTESGEYLSNGFRIHNCFILDVED